MATSLRIQTLEGRLVQHDQLQLSFRFRIGDAAPVATKPFHTGDPQWNDEVTIEVPAHVAEGERATLIVEAVDAEDPDAKFLFASCSVIIHREVWVGDYKGLETAVPLVDGSAHTIGRLQFKFLGKAQATRYQELLDCCWAMTIKSAHLDKEHTALELPPEEWDTRVKITSYPGKSKGTTNLLEDCGRDPVWNETLRAPYEPPMDAPADLVPCYGIKVLNQNLGIPNDLLGRCVFMLPMRRLVEGKEELDMKLDLEHGPGTISLTLKMVSADIEKAQRELKASLVAITGGLSTRFSSKRLHEKLEVEDLHEAAIKRVVSLVAAKELDLEELYQKHGSGGGKGSLATKVAMNVKRLREVLDAWGAEHGDLNLGKSLPARWLHPLGYTDQDPHPSAVKEAEGDVDEGDEFGDDEFGDEFMGDEYGDADAEEDGDDEGSGDEAPDRDVIVGSGVEQVRSGVALDTFADAVGRFSLKNGEMCTQLNHARETALFMDFEAKPDEFLELFHEMDDDATGFITKDELTDGLIDRGMNWLLGHPYFAKMDLDGDGKITYAEFKAWLDGEQEKRKQTGFQRLRTQQLQRQREMRKVKLAKMLTAVDRNKGAAKKMSARKRRMAMIHAMATMAEAEHQHKPKAAQVEADKAVLRSVVWLSSTHFRANSRSQGSMVSKLIMEKLSLFCESSEVKFEDPDWGPGMEEAAGVVEKYDKWLKNMSVEAPMEQRQRKIDEFGTNALYHQGVYRKGGPKPKSVRWKRLEEDEDGNQPSLFKDGAGAGDVVQGKLGDCWFIGAMSLIATRDDLLDTIFQHSRASGAAKHGLYVLRFSKGADFHYVMIDDKLPVSGRRDKLVYASGKNPLELWPALVEKAYAKLHGSYSSLAGGYVDEGLRDLTGNPTQALRLPHSLMPPGKQRLFAAQYGGSVINQEGGKASGPISAEEEHLARHAFNRHLRQLRGHGSMLGCSHRCPGNAHSWEPDETGLNRLKCIKNPTTGKSKVEAQLANGILQRHAYAIVDIVEVKELDEVILRVRNPWGFREWTGEYSDVDERVKNDEKLQEILKRNFAEITLSNGQTEADPYGADPQDGTFLIKWHDWVEHYTHLFACVSFPLEWFEDTVEGQWDENSAGGPLGGSETLVSWHTNPRYEVTITEEKGKNFPGDATPNTTSTVKFATVFIELCQGDPRLTEGHLYYKKLLPICFHVVDADDKTTSVFPPPFVPDSRPRIPQPYARKSMCLSVEVQVPLGRYYIIPSTSAGAHGTFTLTVHSTHPVSIVSDKQKPLDLSTAFTPSKMTKKPSMAQMEQMSLLSAAVDDDDNGREDDSKFRIKKKKKKKGRGPSAGAGAGAGAGADDTSDDDDDDDSDDDDSDDEDLDPAQAKLKKLRKEQAATLDLDAVRARSTRRKAKRRNAQLTAEERRRDLAATEAEIKAHRDKIFKQRRAKRLAAKRKLVEDRDAALRADRDVRFRATKQRRLSGAGVPKQAWPAKQQPQPSRGRHVTFKGHVSSSESKGTEGGVSASAQVTSFGAPVREARAAAGAGAGAGAGATVSAPPSSGSSVQADHQRRLELLAKEKMLAMRRERAFRRRKSERLAARASARRGAIEEAQQTASTSFGALVRMGTLFHKAKYTPMPDGRLFSLHGKWKAAALLASDGDDTTNGGKAAPKPPRRPRVSDSLDDLQPSMPSAVRRRDQKPDNPGGDEPEVPDDIDARARKRRRQKAKSSKRQHQRLQDSIENAAVSVKQTISSGLRMLGFSMSAPPQAPRSAAGAPPGGGHMAMVSSGGGSDMVRGGGSVASGGFTPRSGAAAPTAGSVDLGRSGILCVQVLACQDLFQLQGVRHLMSEEHAPRLRVEMEVTPWGAASCLSPWAQAVEDGDAVWADPARPDLGVASFMYPGLKKGVKLMLRLLVECELRNEAGITRRSVVASATVNLPEAMCNPGKEVRRWVDAQPEVPLGADSSSAAGVVAGADGFPSVELSMIFIADPRVAGITNPEVAAAARGPTGHDAAAASSVGARGGWAAHLAATPSNASSSATSRSKAHRGPVRDGQADGAVTGVAPPKPVKQRSVMVLAGSGSIDTGDVPMVRAQSEATLSGGGTAPPRLLTNGGDHQVNGHVDDEFDEAVKPQPPQHARKRTPRRGTTTPSSRRYGPASNLSSDSAFIKSPSGRMMQHPQGSPVVPSLWAGAHSCFNDGRNMAARIDGSAQHVYAMVKVLEKTAPFKLMFIVTVPDVMSATREISVEDLQWIITLEQQVGAPVSDTPLLDDERKANEDMQRWATTRKIPTRRAVILWLCQRMVLVKEGSASSIRLKSEEERGAAGAPPGGSGLSVARRLSTSNSAGAMSPPQSARSARSSRSHRSQRLANTTGGLSSLAGAPRPGGARKPRPQPTVSQSRWLRRKKRARVLRTLGEWQECKDRKTSAVFYFNTRTMTGVETLEDTGDELVIAAARRSTGLKAQDWVPDETIGLKGQSFGTKSPSHSNVRMKKLQ